MEHTKHIEKLENQVKEIDKAIDRLRGANPDTPNYEKIQELQGIAGEKERQIERLKYLANMSYERLNATYHLLREMEELFSGKEYAFIKDEIPEVTELIYKVSAEFDDEKSRRFV